MEDCWCERHLAQDEQGRQGRPGDTLTFKGRQRTTEIDDNSSETTILMQISGRSEGWISNSSRGLPGTTEPGEYCEYLQVRHNNQTLVEEKKKRPGGQKGAIYILPRGGPIRSGGQMRKGRKGQGYSAVEYSFNPYRDPCQKCQGNQSSLRLKLDLIDWRWLHN